MFIFFVLRESSSAWPGDGEVSAGDEDDGQSSFRNSERRLGLGVTDARTVTLGSRSGVGDTGLVCKTQGGSMTVEVVRIGGTTGGGRGLVTGRRCGSGRRLGCGNSGGDINTDVGEDRWVKLGQRGGRGKGKEVISGLDGRIKVFLCLKGAVEDCGRLGSGGKAPGSERSKGMAGGGGSEADSSSRSAEMEDGVRRLP